ncbi:hypothetical protein [uncultured Flavobacterium sp.]|uniref:hypothetical protein n=1 Tax=uncultured Flavobacterium sp. TaxID=165435 RepID=UPI0025E7C264|nr:hypothetical protein [uncultured Flavobacterium sp.]
MDIHSDLQREWNEKGAAYGTGINEMVAFGETHGWDKWTGEEPVDEREHLADEVVRLLREANESGRVAEFREAFPPSYSPLIEYIKKNEQNIELFTFITGEKIVFFVTKYDQKPQGYLLDGGQLMELDAGVRAIGKSKQGNVFAIINGTALTTTKGWEGETIATFDISWFGDAPVTNLLPFNDGKQALLVSSAGIYLITAEGEKLIHPVQDEDEELDEDEEQQIDLSMENADLSHDNRYIVAADQDGSHRVLNASGEQVGEIGPQSSYPHFCLFSSNDEQLITNSCHFYNGVTVGVDTSKLDNIAIEAYKDSGEYVDIDESMRVYAGVAADGYYILGDAHGYIKAFDTNGRQLWRHYLGSTINGMCLSDDGNTLWVGSYSGMVHKLRLGAGHRDKHTIGNGNHYEEFRIILRKDKPALFW